MCRVLFLIVLWAISSAGCNSSPSTVSSGDSTIHAIDPKGTLRDTGNYFSDSNRLDSGNIGVTH